MELILVAHLDILPAAILRLVCSFPSSLQPSFLGVVRVQPTSFIRTFMSSLAMSNARYFVGRFANKLVQLPNIVNANRFGSDSFLTVSKEATQLFLFGGNHRLMETDGLQAYLNCFPSNKDRTKFTVVC